MNISIYLQKVKDKSRTTQCKMRLMFHIRSILKWPNNVFFTQKPLAVQDAIRVGIFLTKVQFFQKTNFKINFKISHKTLIAQ